MTKAVGQTELVLDRTFAGTTGTLASSRAAIAEAAAARGVDAETIDRLKLVLSELTTNAVQASPGLPYRVVVAAVAGGLRLTVENRNPSGHVPHEADWGRQDQLRVRGRGLLIVRQLSESVEVVEDEHEWVRVTAVVAASTGGASKRSSPADRH